MSDSLAWKTLTGILSMLVNPWTSFAPVILSSTPPQPATLPPLGQDLHESFVPTTFSLFLLTLTILRSTQQVFCRTPLSWDLSIVFLMIRFGLWFWGRRSILQMWGAVLITVYPKCVLSTWLISVDTELNNLTHIVFVMHLHYKLILFCLFPYSAPGKEDIMFSPHLRNEELRWITE